MISEGSSSSDREYRPWVAFALNLIPLPFGLGYFYVARYDLVMWSMPARIGSLVAAYAITVFTQQTLVEAINPDCFLDHGSGYSPTVETGWITFGGILALTILISSIHAARVANRKRTK